MCTCRAPIKSSAKLLKDKNRNWRLLTLDGSHQRWRCIDVPWTTVQYIFHVCWSGACGSVVCAASVRELCASEGIFFCYTKWEKKEVFQLSQRCSSKVPVRKEKKEKKKKNSVMKYETCWIEQVLPQPQRGRDHVSFLQAKTLCQFRCHPERLGAR